MLKKLATVYVDPNQEILISKICADNSDMKKRAVISRIFSEGLNVVLSGGVKFGEKMAALSQDPKTKRPTKAKKVIK